MSIILPVAQAEPTDAPQKDWPKKVTLTIGDVKTRIESEKMWTISGLDFQGTPIATEDSAYGTVVTIRNVGHLGTAHFLDVPGKPGEIEKENVTSFRLTIDGKPVTSFEPTMNLQGKAFRMDRVSKVRDLDLVEYVSIEDDVVVETSNWHANKKIDLQMSYPLMYAWMPDMTDYAFGDDNGLLKTGKFRDEGKSDDSGREKSVTWMAVFNAKSGKGAVCYLMQRPANVETLFQWTDAPHVYRKLRIMTFIESFVPDGFKGTYQSAVGFYNATQADWQKQAVERVHAVKAAAEKRKS